MAHTAYLGRNKRRSAFMTLDQPNEGVFPFSTLCRVLAGLFVVGCTSIAHRQLPGRSIPHQPFHGSASTHVVKNVQTWSESLAQRNVGFVLVPLPLARSSFEASSSSIDALADMLSESGLRFAADPHTASQPDDHYFDTPYHLGGLGVQQRTEWLAEILESATEF